MASSRALLSVDYEVFGKVQGVFFRKYTQKKAIELGLVGWVQNTKRGTVIGQVQGQTEKVKEMKEWLKRKGSPKSRTERCVFRCEQSIGALDFTGFVVVK